jgi:hypothetical protein
MELQKEEEEEMSLLLEEKSLESSVVVGGGGKGLGKGTTTYGSTPQLSSATTGLITSPISNIRRGHSSR